MTVIDNTFQTDLERLNALCGPVWRWERVVARSEHDDVFGDRILPKETYFRKQFSNGYGDFIKLSHRSMKTFLFATIGSNPWLQNVADCLVEKERSELSAAVDSINL